MTVRRILVTLSLVVGLASIGRRLVDASGVVLTVRGPISPP